MKNLRRTVEGFRKGILNGGDPDMMCFAVCAPLQAYLGLLGVKTKLVDADFEFSNHVWLEMEDGTVIDPTADQFNSKFVKMPKVYIGPRPDWYPPISRRPCTTTT